MKKLNLLLVFFFYSLILFAQNETNHGELNVAYFVRFSELEMALIPIDTNQLKKILMEEIQSVEMIHENVQDVMGKDYAGQDAIMILSLTAKGEQNLKYLQRLGAFTIKLPGTYVGSILSIYMMPMSPHFLRHLSWPSRP